MNTLDERLAAATSDLQRDVAGLSTPPFKPNRPAAPVVLALVLLLGIGIAAIMARTSADGTGSIAVATQPETPDADEREPETAGLETDPSDPDLGDPDSEDAQQESGATAATAVNEGEAESGSGWRAITSPVSGEFFVPVSTVGAWSPDETKVIVYRTGAADPAHLVYDTFDFGATAAPIELPFDPPDIEQVYWHPLVEDQLVYATGANLMVFDLNTRNSVIEKSFDGCASIDSGVLPVAPANDGTMSLLCRSATEVTQLSYNLATGDDLRASTASDTAAVPSPSGDALVRWNGDGSASVLDRSLVDTGIELDLQGNLFGFVVDAGGREWVATTLFDGPAVGSVVLLPLDGQGPPIVAIGPDRGDPYPPTGTVISTAGDKIAVSIEGADDGLAGRITLLDFGESLTEARRRSIPHTSEDMHGYWSTPFVSVSPSGAVLYSTDLGADSVTTIVGSFIE